MPVLLEQTDITLEVADLGRRHRHTPIQTPRSRGVHLSGVLYVCAVAAGVLRPGEPIEDDLPTICALGLAWEEFAASLYPDLLYQPGEVELDGVFMTCDGLNNLPSERASSELAVEEFKFTQKKLMDGEEFLRSDKAWYYRAQGMGYCAGYGPELVRWHVMFVRGDHSWSELGKPVYRRLLVRFSPDEIRKNWRMVQANRENAVPE